MQESISKQALLKIQNLIKLLDVESAEIRQTVRNELLACSEQWIPLMDQLHRQYSPEVMYQLHQLVKERHSAAIRAIWPGWLGIRNPMVRLEVALAFLADVQTHGGSLPQISQLLDQLALEFLEREPRPGVLELNRFLFVSDRFRGALEDYYHPQHSNLRFTLLENKGLPITLVCLFILCGYRLGLKVCGINLPGHFLAKAEVDGKAYLFDCFNNGKILTHREMNALAVSTRIDLKRLMADTPSPLDIVVRILLNLINAYNRAGEIEKFHLTQDLLAALRSRQKVAQPKVTRKVQFKRGQLVRHRRYGYRGVIVDFDKTCRADEAWYRSNRTQPERNQPWYHVLVDTTSESTYAAQTSLQADPSKAQIRHPLISRYFGNFTNGRYQRNDLPWRFSD